MSAYEGYDEGNIEQHVLHIVEPGAGERLVKFDGWLVEQTEGWNVYLTSDDRVVAQNEANRRAEILSVDEAKQPGSLPRFKKLREVLGEPEPEDL